MITQLTQKKYFIPVFLLGYVITLQLFLSIDSYLYANNNHYDSAIFFMCGKALINGYIPYEEFADSKGLLLWFIYGIAYLIDHYSYIGVYWLLCLFYWITFWLDYKIARLWLSQSYSILASLTMAIPLWYWNFYVETKAEHFCLPFITYTLYQFFLIIKQRYKYKLINKGFLFIGIGWVCVLMIKWSIAIMMFGLLISIGAYTFKVHILKNYIINLLMGIIFAAIPFVIYFNITQSWQAMIQEYFINTLSSVNAPLKETIQSYIDEWIKLFTTKRVIYVIYILPLLLLWNKKNWFITSLPFLSALFFIALSIRHAFFGHYISAVSPFAIFGIISILRYIQKHKIKAQHYCIFLTLGVIYIVYGKIHYSTNFFTKAQSVTEFENINYMISQIEKPTLINMGQDRGFGMGYTLPYCRYWITQMGRTKEMLTEQEHSLYEAKADFICLSGQDLIRHYEKSVLKMGYNLIADYQGNRLYTKHQVKSHNDQFKVQPLDIILKRNTGYTNNEKNIK